MKVKHCSVCLCVCLFVCMIKPKLLKLKSPELGTGIVHHESSHQLILDQNVKVKGSEVQKGDRVVGVSYALY